MGKDGIKLGKTYAKEIAPKICTQMTVNHNIIRVFRDFGEAVCARRKHIDIV